MYGLIGEKLGHSFSKQIHEQLASYTYELIPLTKAEFHSFMKEKKFHAINVTIPYKQEVIPYLDIIDDKAEKIHAVNTIVNKNGVCIGYNTDYDGFAYMLKQHHVDILNKKVMVLGNGGAAQAIKAVVKDLDCQELILVKSRLSDETIGYEEAYKNHADVDIIINTSPIGMYPNNDRPIDLARFSKCQYFIDIIYNPLRTACMMQANALAIQTIGGLEMLVAQAKYAVEYFNEISIEDTCIDKIYQQIHFQQSNIVLIGMPSCGKTTIAQKLALVYQKIFIDIDDEIVKEAGKSIKDIFLEDGEDAFRDLEESIIKRVSLEHNQVIATGGGCIKRENNIFHLKQNGCIIFLDRDKELLITEDKERPLSSGKEQVYQMYDERFPLYMKYADVQVKNNTTETEVMKDIQLHMHDIMHNL